MKQQQSALKCRITRYVIKHFYEAAVKVVVAAAHTHTPARLHLKAVSVNRSVITDREVTASDSYSGFTLALKQLQLPLINLDYSQYEVWPACVLISICDDPDRKTVCCPLMETQINAFHPLELSE